MFLVKYKKEIILFALYMLVPVGWLIASVVVGGSNRIIAFLPGNGMFDQAAMIFIILMIKASLGVVVYPSPHFSNSP